MNDRELLERIRALGEELETLTRAADQNAKYHTQSVLSRMRDELSEVEDTLAWHVGD